MTGDSELALYIHWPFCQAKCPYCDFNSHVRAQGIDEERFTDAFRKEIAHVAARIEPATVSSIFFGGGTPSLMSERVPAAILDAVASHWTMRDDVEVTLEANPTSVEAGRFAAYRREGVNRVSLGIQSLRDAELKKLGRLHSADEALRALEVAKANFERVSFDLIYARPDQDEAAWETELREALDLAQGHLSLYQLTIEPGTPFAALHAAGKLAPPDAETAANLFERTQDMTASEGYSAYEISNHALAGQESRHNLIYWRGGDYVGIGPGAHGRVRIGGVRHRTDTRKGPEDWLEAVERDGHGLTVSAPLSPSETAEEYLLMSLRLAEGMDVSVHAGLGGSPIDPGRIEILKRESLIATDGTRLKATDSGRLVLNSIIAVLAGA